MLCFQIVNLSVGEQEWLSKHLGHDIQIDKDFYRQHDGIVEVAKISRILMMVDSDKTAKYAGRSLKEIGIEGVYHSHFASRTLKSILSRVKRTGV